MRALISLIARVEVMYTNDHLKIFVKHANVEGNITRFSLHRCTIDICTYSRKEILFLKYMSMSLLLIEVGLAHVKIL